MSFAVPGKKHFTVSHFSNMMMLPNDKLQKTLFAQNIYTKKLDDRRLKRHFILGCLKLTIFRLKIPTKITWLSQTERKWKRNYFLI